MCKISFRNSNYRFQNKHIAAPLGLYRNTGKSYFGNSQFFLDSNKTKLREDKTELLVSVQVSHVYSNNLAVNIA
jgi:hypothetical protein